VARECLVGIDVGTTAVKAILIDMAGKRLANFTQRVAISRPSSGHAQQNPHDWLNAVVAALAQFDSGHDLSALAGIGICSQVNTHVFVGADGEPLMPAMTWQDTRCAAIGAALDTQVSAGQKTAWLGGQIPIDASHALSRIAYVAKLHPDVHADTRHVLLPKDYCVMRLTGAVLSDPISAIGLVGQTGEYVNELLDLAPRAHELLPELRTCHSVAGRVRPGFPCAGVPVVVGVMDAWGGMFGIGVARDGQAGYQSGTSEILGIVSPVVNPTPGIIIFPPYRGIVFHEAPTQSGGAALDWFSSVVGKHPEQLSAEIANVAALDAVPLFLPHLQGERAPLWDASSRGVFARIDSRTGLAEMACSVMEGVAYSARLAFEELQRSSAESPSVANIGGGGARSDAWCQIRADALGMALRRTVEPEAAAARGAAILAGLGCGTMNSLNDAIHQLVGFDRTFEPRTAYRTYHDERFSHYTALYEELRDFNARYTP
jgi:xylulokinase